MRKNLLAIAVMLTGSALFTACLNSDDNTPSSWQGIVSKGAYVVCGGGSSSLSYIDYGTATAEQRVFQKANNRELGSDANDAVLYGSKMYVVVSGENIIEVIDPKTGVSIRQISTIGLMGGEQGENPRHIATGNGVVYVSTYGSSSHEYDEEGNVTSSGHGYVAAIDTVSFGLQKLYDAGSYPEGLYATDTNLYVANSDGGAGVNASISVINLSSGAETQKKHANIRNPQDVVALVGGSYFVLDWGESDAEGKQLNAGVYRVDGDDVTKRIDNATMWLPISFSNGYTVSSYIYTVNAPKGASAVTYERYDLNTLSRVAFTTNGVFWPSAIGVDPITGYVYVGSYKENPVTNLPDYDSNGYVRIYDPQNGKVIKEFDCGMHPKAFAFNLSIETITLN